MIKCPNCGSTAQVKLTKQYWSDISQSQFSHFICGCGCIFTVERMSCGITNGHWQVSNTQNHSEMKGSHPYD